MKCLICTIAIIEKKSYLDALSGQKIDNQHVERIESVEKVLQEWSFDEASPAIV